MDEAQLTTEPGKLPVSEEDFWASGSSETHQVDGCGARKRRWPGLQSCSANSQSACSFSIYNLRETGGRGTNLQHIERLWKTGELSRMISTLVCVCAPSRGRPRNCFFFVLFCFFRFSKGSPTQKNKYYYTGRSLGSFPLWIFLISKLQASESSWQVPNINRNTA